MEKKSENQSLIYWRYLVLFSCSLQITNNFKWWKPGKDKTISQKIHQIEEETLIVTTSDQENQKVDKKLQNCNAAASGIQKINKKLQKNCRKTAKSHISYCLILRCLLLEKIPYMHSEVKSIFEIKTDYILKSILIIHLDYCLLFRVSLYSGFQRNSTFWYFSL